VVQTHPRQIGGYQVSIYISDREKDQIKRQRRQVRQKRLEKARLRGTHTKIQWEALLEVCGDTCLRCNDYTYGLTKDHIIPLHQDDSSDGIENIQPLCCMCNVKKRGERIDFRPIDWEAQMWEILKIWGIVKTHFPTV
jgi:hypothetical protein